MAVLKCKMCGGELTIDTGSTICECEYCGSKQTIPGTDDEKRLKLYERANRLRFECEFDKAAGVYEAIVADYQEEAEAYWGLVLCKYGIEYVDDSGTHKKIPTCHRSSFESVMDDANYELVMENSDTLARGLYREEAKRIEEIRKGIIKVSSAEEPYDIFICYKETAEDGQRTIDSVIAQNVYEELTERGYRVFFSRITLEDKLGQEYEPYIFAALNSAKVMLAFGTSYDYYNAVWVKNEWSRFLQLIAAGQKKTLIPCFKDIDAYDIPKEFKHLQAQDMGKVGAVQDLIRGIDKIFSLTSDRQNSSSSSATGDVVNTLKRGMIYLRDKDFEKASEYFDKVLDMDVENAQAYYGKFLSSNNCSMTEELIENKLLEFNSVKGNKKKACEPDRAFVKEIITNYSDNRYFPPSQIDEMLKYDVTYESVEEAMEDSLLSIETSIKNDRDYMHSIEFADETVSSEVEKINKSLFSYCRSRIKEQNEREKAIRSEIEKNYHNYLHEKEIECQKKREVIINKLEKDYQSAISLRMEGKYQSAIQSFVDLGNYKDSVSQLEYTKNQLSQVIQNEQLKRIEEKKKEEEEIERLRKIEIEEQFKERNRYDKNKKTKMIILIILALIVLIFVTIVLVWVAMNSDKDKKKGRAYWDYPSELTSYSFESWEASYNDIELENNSAIYECISMKTGI